MSLLAKRLIYLRESVGFTQDEVSKLLKISRSTYSNYENDHREPSLQILEEFAKLYNVPISYLLGDNSITYDKNLNQYQVLSPISRLSFDEILLLDKYRALDMKSKREVLDLVKLFKYKSFQITRRNRVN